MKFGRCDWRVAVAIVSLVLTQSSCSTWRHWRERREAERKLAWLRTAVPAQDVTAAVMRNDLRFVGVHGATPEVPGVPEDEQKLAEEAGVRFLDGTGAGHDRLNRKARKYAQRYNKLLRLYLRGGRTLSSRA